MAKNVEDRIVELSFSNKDFERGVTQSLSTLDKLKKSLNFTSKNNGLDQVQQSANRFSLRGVTSSVDSVTAKFSAMSAIGITALATLVNKAVDAGLRIAKSFTITPIAAGFENYQTQINAVQTILANTGLKGAKGLSQVNSVLQDLNTYANQTVYSFSEMTENIGRFTAAGVKLKPATDAIKGMANSAALTGANSQQLSTAMYQMSQALSTGTIRLQDWNSLSNANLGTKNIQEALKATARTVGDGGKTMDAAIKKYGSFRQSLQSGWLSADIFTKAMGVMAGTVDKATGKYRAFTVEELKAKGYTQASAVELNRLSQAAIDSAIKIRTAKQLGDALKEEVATAFSAIFKTVFGDINQATDLFTKIHIAAENALTNPIYALNKLLIGWSKLGGRTALIKSVSAAFKALGAVMKPIHQAFNDIFPKTTAKQLVDMTVRFQKFMESLKIGATTSSKLRKVFNGLFSILDIGRQIILGVIHVIGSLFGGVSKNSGGFLDAAANVGDFLTRLDMTLKKGNQIGIFFAKLGGYIQAPLAVLGRLGHALSALFDAFKSNAADKTTASFGRLSQRMSGLSRVLEGIKNFFASGLDINLSGFFKKVSAEFSKFQDAVVKGMSSGNFSKIFDVINTGMLLGIVVLVKKFLAKGINVDVGGGVFKTLKESFETLTGSLKALQTNIQAHTLLTIAIAVGVLTASIIALSLVDSKKLTIAMGAIATAFGELLGGLKGLIIVSGNAGFVKIPLIASSLVILALALDVMSIAVRSMAKLSWDALSRGLAGIAALFTLIDVSVIPLSKNAKGMIGASIGIKAIGVAMNIMTLAVLAMSRLSYKDMVRGLAGVTGALTAVTVAVRQMPPNMIIVGIGLNLVAISLAEIAGVVKLFSLLSWKDIGRGLTALAGSLTIITVALNSMDFAEGGAASLIAAALAIDILTPALTRLGKLKWSEIARGLVTMGGALAIIAATLYALTFAEVGAGSLLVAAIAVGILTGALVQLAKLSWSQLLRALVGLAGGLLVLGGMSALLAPLIPVLAALGVALTLIGAGFALAGAGALAFAAAFGIFAAIGSDGISVVVGALKSLFDLLPTLGKDLAETLVVMVKTIADAAPGIVSAFTKILIALSDSVTQAAPHIAVAMNTLIGVIIAVVGQNAPKIIAMGINLMLQFLAGIQAAIPQLTVMVVRIVLTFLNTLASYTQRIVNAGIAILETLIMGIGNKIGDLITVGEHAAINFIGGITRSLSKVLRVGTDAVIYLIQGLASNANRIVATGANALISFVRGIAQNLTKVVSAAAQILIDFLNGLASAIRYYSPQLRNAGLNLISAIIDGMSFGIASKIKGVADKLIGGLEGMLGGAGKFLGIGGPSKVFMDVGYSIMNGLSLGIANKAADVAKDSVKATTSIVSAMQETLAKIPEGVNDLIDMKPVIAPVLDLTDVQKNASLLNKMVGTGQAFSTDVSYQQASAVANSQNGSKSSETTASAGINLKLEQNNYSPTALSPIEIYRNTRNQAAMLKDQLERIL